MVTPDDRFIISQASDIKVFEIRTKQQVYHVQKKYSRK